MKNKFVIFLLLIEKIYISYVNCKPHMSSCAICVSHPTVSTFVQSTRLSSVNREQFIEGTNFKIGMFGGIKSILTAIK